MARVVFLGPGEGRQLLVGTNMVTLKAVTGDTEGRFSVMEHRLDAYGPSPSLHVHEQLDHAVYVLEGTVVFTVAQRQLTAPAGSFVLIPHGIAHTFANPSDAVARFVEVDTPPASNGTLSVWPRRFLPAARSILPPWWPSRPSTTPIRRPPDPLSPRAGQVRQAIAGNDHHHHPSGGLVGCSWVDQCVTPRCCMAPCR
jgi:mannose-6-phosphate isomerase-like protein (cupin superfamily)